MCTVLCTFSFVLNQKIWKKETSTRKFSSSHFYYCSFLPSPISPPHFTILFSVCDLTGSSDLMYTIISHYYISKQCSENSILHTRICISSIDSGIPVVPDQKSAVLFHNNLFLFQSFRCLHLTFPLRKNSRKITVHWIAKKDVILPYTSQWMKCACTQTRSNIPVDGADGHPVYIQNFVVSIYFRLWCEMAFLITHSP